MGGMTQHISCILYICCLSVLFNFTGNWESVDAQMQEDLELVIDLERQETKTDSKLFTGVVISTGRVFILNKSAKDVTIRYNLDPSQFLQVEIFDRDGKRVVRESYLKRLSPISVDGQFELTISKNSKARVAGVDVRNLLRQAKQPPGTYTVIGYYEVNGLPKLTSKQHTFVVKDK